MDTGASEREVGVVVGTTRNEMVQQQYQSGFAFVETVAEANPLLQYRSSLYGIDKTGDKCDHDCSFGRYFVCNYNRIRLKKDKFLYLREFLSFIDYSGGSNSRGASQVEAEKAAKAYPLNLTRTIPA
jgi:hypothetical protein